MFRDAEAVAGRAVRSDFLRSDVRRWTAATLRAIVTVAVAAAASHARVQ